MESKNRLHNLKCCKALQTDKASESWKSCFLCDGAVLKLQISVAQE
jgi:hypothetical protein